MGMPAKMDSSMAARLAVVPGILTNQIGRSLVEKY